MEDAKAPLLQAHSSVAATIKLHFRRPTHLLHTPKTVANIPASTLTDTTSVRPLSVPPPPHVTGSVIPTTIDTVHKITATTLTDTTTTRPLSVPPPPHVAPHPPASHTPSPSPLPTVPDHRLSPPDDIMTVSKITGLSVVDATALLLQAHNSVAATIELHFQPTCTPTADLPTAISYHTP